MIPLFQQLDRETAETYSLVLNSAGIGHWVIATGDVFRIDVPESVAEAAREAIRRYRAENPIRTADPTTGHTRPARIPLSGLSVAFVLLVVHWAIMASTAPPDYSRVFGADARRIMAGEVYRCATALVLHADATHLAGNMAGIALFGSVVCMITGSGLGWLLILICGILGNLVNAWAYQSDHLSVGASTAVFGALGILCSIQGMTAIRTGRGWQRMILIVGAGLALLALLGTSARSDIGAHLFGCLAGASAGVVYGRWMGQPPAGRGQLICGAIAVSLLLFSWIRGVVG